MKATKLLFNFRPQERVGVQTDGNLTAVNLMKIRDLELLSCTIVITRRARRVELSCRTTVPSIYDYNIKQLFIGIISVGMMVNIVATMREVHMALLLKIPQSLKNL